MDEIKGGKGIYLFNKNGDKIFDLSGGDGAAILGHANHAITECIIDQAKRVVHFPCKDGQNKLVSLLKDELPHCYKYFIFGVSGSETIEHSLLVALRKKRVPYIISFDGAYHGSTISLLNISIPEHWGAMYSAIKVHRISKPKCNWCHYKKYKSSSSCGFECLNVLKKENFFAENCAALLLEPIFSNDVVIPPEGFLSEIRASCDELGIALIDDEVTVGLGRTGEMFAFQYDKVTPDIVCLGKGLANGLPLSVSIYKDVFDSDTLEDVRILQSTFSANILACTVAVKVIRMIKENHMCSEVRRKGNLFLDLLTPLEEFKIIKEVRGRGLLIGIEFIKADSGEPSLEHAQAFAEHLAKYKIYVEKPYTNTLVLTPPYTITYDEIIQISEILKMALRNFQKM